MIAPHFELIIQCVDVVKGLPIHSWESQARPAKRAAGLVGRWAIEKAFESAILAHGGEIPKDRVLDNLRKTSGVSLSNEQLLLLPIVDREVTSNEPEEANDMGLYLDCCWLARGIVGTIHQHLSLIDILARKNSEEKP